MTGLEPPAFARLVNEVRAIIRTSRFDRLDDLVALVDGIDDRRRLSELVDGNKLPDRHLIQAIVKECAADRWPEISHLYNPAAVQLAASAAEGRPQLADWL